MIQIIGGLAFLVVAGASAAAAAWHSSHRAIVILGERGTGKSHLLKFLKTGTLPSDYSATLGVEPSPKGVIELGDLKLRLKSSKDIGGGEENMNLWFKEFKKSDAVIYMVNVCKLDGGIHESNVYSERLEYDLRHLHSWTKEKDWVKTKPFVLVCSFVDLDPRKQTLAAADYRAVLFANPHIRAFKMDMESDGMNLNILVGSLESEASTRVLAIEIVKILLGKE